MRFKPLPLEGAYLIELEPKKDDRGSFTRTFCSVELSQQGLKNRFVQSNHSVSHQKGTLRGLHYQLSPMAEVKVVRCLKGSLYDVIVDLREQSPTFGQSFGTTLSSENGCMMYVPEGFAHGFLTLEDNTEVLYFVSEYYSKEMERGLRWNDPRFQISWPEAPKVISERDQHHADFDPLYHLNACAACHHP